jgi:epoxyqueuosine reductase
MGADWKSELREKARRQGFGDVRVAAATVPPEAAIHYRRWLAQAFHGEMRYMEATTELRLAPERLLPDARSVLVFRADYYPHSMRPSAQPGMARIAKYALGLDYHYVLRARLQELLPWLDARFPGQSWRIAIDSAPVLERAFAIAAGIGFRGRNTMVITPRHGSYYFLALIVTSAGLEPDPPIVGTCGSCTRCLDACPTAAFPEPYVLDARRCISYLTIEKRSPLTELEMAALGQWIFGCDVCQDVCPYNRRPAPTPFDEFRAGVRIHEFVPPDLFLEPRSNREFARRFEGSPLMRAGRKRLQALAAHLAAKRAPQQTAADGAPQRPGS